MLQNVATGVIAVDKHLVVGMANSRAEQIVGERLEPGVRLDASPAAWQPLWASVRAFLEPDEDRAEVASPQEFDVGDRRIRMQIARLKGGAVVALDDTTELATAERVLAWGEMARQVAHEVKNPLTPIKLSVQHIRRAWADRRQEFAPVLDRNVETILKEIDRLTEIAQSFSRFGAPAAAGEIELEPVDVARIAADILTLYESGGEGPIRISSRIPEGLPPVSGRSAEFREVLLNLLENARAAIEDEGQVVVEAVSVQSAVEVRVRDDGVGIPDELIGRIFEPRFSTRSTGTGLGLAIVRRLVESWGGTVTAESGRGEGTTIRLHLRPWEAEE